MGPWIRLISVGDLMKRTLEVLSKNLAMSRLAYQIIDNLLPVHDNNSIVLI